MNEWMLKGFIGYGRLSALLWLLGMEEFCRDDDDAAARLKLLPHLPLAAGVTETHLLYGYSGLPTGVTVWEMARQICRACGLRTDVGELGGDVLLCELLPLPRPSNDSDCWPLAYGQLFADYRMYERAILRPRAQRIVHLISEQRPHVVLVHGRRYHAHVEDALMQAGATVVHPSVLLGNKQARVVRHGATEVVFVDNLGRAAAWSTQSRASLIALVASLWRGEPPTLQDPRSYSRPVDSLLAGMFFHRASNVLPISIVSLLRGYRHHAARAEVAALTETCEFRDWATRHVSMLGGRTPIDACVARDLADLRDPASRYTRLHKRYGGGRTLPELAAAVELAHAEISRWASAVR